MESLKPPDRGPDIEAVHITVRFSASLPDLLLTIDNPSTATTATLKQQIRKQLPSDLSDRRIRLIYAGKALLDISPLSTSLKLSPSRNPSRTSTPVPYNDRPGNKGKAPIYDQPALTRIYIHCSIGDATLTPSDLSTEASEATVLTSTPKHDASATLSTNSGVGPSTTSQTSTSTTPAPRGFDRLLSAGFSPNEIRTLRSQFMAIQAHSHTPDTMPSPSTLRDLEDRWLDNESSDPSSTATAGSAAGMTVTADEDASGALDDLLWGAVMGFFWPVGCLWWACRSDGIWSRRKKWAVVLGCLINAGVGGLRWLS